MCVLHMYIWHICVYINKYVIQNSRIQVLSQVPIDIQQFISDAVPPKKVSTNLRILKSYMQLYNNNTKRFESYFRKKLQKHDDKQ